MKKLNLECELYPCVLIPVVLWIVAIVVLIFLSCFNDMQHVAVIYAATLFGIGGVTFLIFFAIFCCSAIAQQRKLEKRKQVAEVKDVEVVKGLCSEVNSYNNTDRMICNTNDTAVGSCGHNTYMTLPTLHSGGTDDIIHTSKHCKSNTCNTSCAGTCKTECDKRERDNDGCGTCGGPAGNDSGGCVIGYGVEDHEIGSGGGVRRCDTAVGETSDANDGETGGGTGCGGGSGTRDDRGVDTGGSGGGLSSGGCDTSDSGGGWDSGGCDTGGNDGGFD